MDFWINKEPDFDISYEDNFLSFIDVLAEEEDTND